MIQDDKQAIRTLAGHVEDLLLGLSISNAILVMVQRMSKEEFDRLNNETKRVMDSLNEINEYCKTKNEFTIKKVSGWKLDDAKSGTPFQPTAIGVTYRRMGEEDMKNANLN